MNSAVVVLEQRVQSFHGLLIWSYLRVHVYVRWSNVELQMVLRWDSELHHLWGFLLSFLAFLITDLVLLATFPEYTTSSYMPQSTSHRTSVKPPISDVKISCFLFQLRVMHQVNASSLSSTMRSTVSTSSYHIWRTDRKTILLIKHTSQLIQSYILPLLFWLD